MEPCPPPAKPLRPQRPSRESEFLRRVRGHIKHCDDPKVQRIVREIDKRLQSNYN